MRKAIKFCSSWKAKSSPIWPATSGLFMPAMSASFPAGTKHRFQNAGKEPALTFNVYSPPEYAPGEKD